MPTESQIDAFKTAVQSGDTAAVRTLLESDSDLKANIDGPYFSFEKPAIMAASYRRNKAMIETLLDLGADINARSTWWAGSFGVLPVMHDENNEWASYLISKGATIDIFAAAGHDMLDKLEELLAADPSLVNARGGDGQTPLHFARAVGTCRHLLDHGAEIDIRDIDHGSTPAQWGINRPEKLRFLLDRGATRDIFMAFALGDTEAVREMLDSDPALLSSTTAAGPHNPSPAPGEHIYVYLIDNKTSLLHAAAKFDQSGIVKLLLERGLDVGIRGGYDDSTPLHLAAWCNSLNAIDALLDGGADIESVSGERHHNTPCGWAIAAGNIDAVRLLLDRGAQVKDWFLSDAEENLRNPPIFSEPKPDERRQIVDFLKAR